MPWWATTLDLSGRDDTPGGSRFVLDPEPVYCSRVSPQGRNGHHGVDAYSVSRSRPVPRADAPRTVALATVRPPAGFARDVVRNRPGSLLEWVLPPRAKRARIRPL